MSVQKSVRTLLIEKYNLERLLSEENTSIIKDIPPQLLRSDTHNKLQKSINKYNFINSIFQYNNYLINQIINNFIETINENCLSNIKTGLGLTNFDYCVGGSAIWNQLFKDYYDTPNLMSEYEKSAIHNTTVDLHYYLTVASDEYYKYYIKRLLDEVIIVFFDKVNKDEIIISQNLNNIKISKLDISNPTVYKISIDINYEGNLINCELLNLNFYKIIKSDIEYEEENEDEEIIEGIIDGKVINLRNIKDENNCLNIFGLYIYNYISKSNRKPIKNDYDIYKVRDQIFDKYILLGQKLETIEYEFIHNYKLKILYYILHYYKETFSKCKKYYDKYFIKNLKKKIFDETEILKVFDNILRYYLIEQFRPYINHIILLINSDLISKGLPTLFAVGGDSCRRYKNDLSKTEDIDTKLYLSDMSQFPEVEKIIVYRLNQLVSWLIVNKDIVINRTKLLDYLKEKGYDEYCVKIDGNGNLIFSYYDITMKLKHTLFYDLSDASSTFFRFRHIFSTKFPVDLYSSDFQIKNNYKIEKVNDSYEVEREIYTDNELTFDIAFLDISVAENHDETKLSKNDILSNSIPTSRLLFLIKDLINTYNNDESSIMRLINGKNIKDYRRFIDLVKIFKASLFTEELKDNNLILNENMFDSLEFKTEEDSYLVINAQANNKVARYKLDIKPYKDKAEYDDFNSDFNNPIILTYTDFFVEDYNNKRRKNKEKVIFNYDIKKLKKLNESSIIRRGGFANISVSNNNIIKSIINSKSEKSKKSAKSAELKKLEKLKIKEKKISSFNKLKEIAENEKNNDFIDYKYYNKFRKESKEYHRLSKIINTTINNKMKIKILEYLKKLLSF